MQTVSQSYSSQAYTSIQNALTLSSDRASAGLKSVPSQSHTKTSNEENISLSDDGRKLSRNSNTPAVTDEKKSVANDKNSNANQQDLTAEQLKTVSELQKRDREVRTHEQAHLAAAGQYSAGGASFSYTTGPDGKQYANGGSVPIDLGKEKTPEATIQKMRTVRRAALAPASPSGADRNIAAQASAKETQAMKEIQTEAKAPPSGDTNSVNNTTQNGSVESTGSEEATEAVKPPQVSEFSRKSMTSAYQAIAALAS